MKTLGIALLAVSGLLAQNHGGFVNNPYISRAPGSWVFPGGTSALPGVTRTAGSILYPGGGGAQIGIPSLRPALPAGVRNGRAPRGGSYIIGYPVYVGGEYVDPSLYGAPPAQQAPNITVIYPPAPAPVIVNPYAPGEAPSFSLYQPQVQQPSPAAQAPAETAHYLLAFKDHTIYSAVAYWVDGETLHYFTDGNTHNQVSVSLLDRDLTRKLNADTGMEVKLPPVK